MKYKKYQKVAGTKYGICAIYEPDPFGSFYIEQHCVHVSDEDWMWVFYDWCGNPIGLSAEKPEGTDVLIFSKENLPNVEQNLIDYLNKTPLL